MYSSNLTIDEIANTIRETLSQMEGVHFEEIVVHQTHLFAVFDREGALVTFWSVEPEAKSWVVSNSVPGGLVEEGNDHDDELARMREINDIVHAALLAKWPAET